MIVVQTTVVQAFGFRRVVVHAAPSVVGAASNTAVGGSASSRGGVLRGDTHHHSHGHGHPEVANVDVGCTVDTPRCPVLPLRQNLPPCCKEKLIKTLHFTSVRTSTTTVHSGTLFRARRYFLFVHFMHAFSHWSKEA